MKVSIGNYPVYRWYHQAGLVKFTGEPKVEVRIDPWDTYSMDATLAHIVLPMLIQLKRSQHIVVFMEEEDLLNYCIPQYPDEFSPESLEENWQWALGEIIYAFNSKVAEEFHDVEADRVANGFRLFGKYYSKLWD